MADSDGKICIKEGFDKNGASPVTMTVKLYSKVEVMDNLASNTEYLHQGLMLRRPGNGDDWIIYFRKPNGVAKLLEAVRQIREAGIPVVDLTKDQIASQSSNLYQGAKNMFNQITSDAKKFVSENREVIYVVIGIALLDQVLFGGAFRKRLESLINGLLTKAEEKIAPKTLDAKD